MTPEALHACLESAVAARPVLVGLGLRDPDRGRVNVLALAQTLGRDRLRDFWPHLARALTRSPDPDMALNNLERVLARTSDPTAFAALLDNRGRGLETLVHLLAVSQFLADQMVADPSTLEAVRNPPRRSPSTGDLTQLLRNELDQAENDAARLRAFRRFRQRQVLRIGINDVLRERPLEEVTREISRTADAALEVALALAEQQMAARHGTPYTVAGQPARCAAFAFGKLGGEELNYSSDIDLLFVYDDEGVTRGRATSLDNAEFYARVVGEVVRLLSAHTENGQAYRVDLRLRPDGDRGPLARSLAGTLSYYDTRGRTWERQALVKLRPVAGDVELGREFVAAIEPFVYRTYLSVSEIHDIKAMKRRIEQKVRRAGDSGRDVKSGRGGIRDIEFVVQFLQLLNGGDLPDLRQRNTLAALQALESAGCLTPQEYHILDDAYRFLRKVEHRLQLMFDLQTHRLPTAADDLRKLALRMGYVNVPAPSRPRPQRQRSVLDDSPPPTLDPRDLFIEPLDAFLHDHSEKSRLTRQILDHLLHSAFAGESAASEPETDLILEPDPDEATVRAVLGRYPFRDVPAAFRNLMQLARESVPFLSSRRCRHFLAGIAPHLLQALAETPDPDLALVNFERVTASLGAKAILWELFSLNPPSLRLYVDLCATSSFLSDLLINNPGMIDDLLDSLVLNRPRDLDDLGQELAELLRGAEDPEPILHSFQDKELLRIGVRDVLGKDDVQATTAALSDVAEVVLTGVVRGQETLAQIRHPQSHSTRWAILALGKLGGREMSYHSDLDLVFLYDGGENGFYFTDLAQRIIKAIGMHGPMGRLYAVDMRLRPTGQSGSLVVSLEAFHRYYHGGGAQVWERQALTRARVVVAEPDFAREVTTVIEEAAFALPWSEAMADEVRTMRDRLLTGAGARSLKRSPGGLTDIEFLVQLLQLKYGRERPELRSPSTWTALTALQRAGLLAEDEATDLIASYGFLRSAECRLRLVTNRALTEWPTGDDLDKLARRLGFESGGAFAQERERLAKRTAELFQRVVARERA